ncbi:MAG: rhodanese-like domain-containing protein [Pseudomonadota bacterium]
MTPQLPIALLALPLLLGACTPSDGESEERYMPSGYELALAADPDSGSKETAEAAIVELSVDDLRTKLEAHNVRLIDVRRDEEVALGAIPGAEHIALDAFDPAQLDFSDGREVVLYCRSGRRSGIAAERLAAHTGAPAQHLAGGILAWQGAGGELQGIAPIDAAGG